MFLSRKKEINRMISVVGVTLNRITNKGKVEIAHEENLHGLFIYFCSKNDVNRDRSCIYTWKRKVDSKILAIVLLWYTSRIFSMNHLYVLDGLSNSELYWWSHHIMVVWAIDNPRYSIISTRLRKFYIGFTLY